MATALGVDAAATNYRRLYQSLEDEDEADSISVVDDQDVDYADFFDVSRLGIARQGLAQTIDENEDVIRFGLVRSRYGNGASVPSTGNQDKLALQTSPQDALAGDDSGNSGKWLYSLAGTSTSNDASGGDGTEVIVDADVFDSPNLVEAVLALEPDDNNSELIPAGQGYDDSDDSPIDNLLVDTRAEVVRLMADDAALYRECRNAAVVLVVGGSGGNTDPAAIASTFASVTSGSVTKRVPIYVIALTPPAADVATLQAIATNSGGMYFEAINAEDVTRAANIAVAAVHGRAEEFDLGQTSVFQTTSPIVGTVDLANANDVNGVALVNSVVSSGGAPIAQQANVLLTSGFSLPTFEADLRAFRVYRPEVDSTKAIGYKFVTDGTPLWEGHTPAGTPRNVYTWVPGSGVIPFTSDAATAAALQVDSVDEATELIEFVRAQPLGAIIDSTPAIMDPPSLNPPPDVDYATFASERADRRSMVFVGANDGMIHGVDARLGVDVWGFIPFNLLPKLRKLLSGQAVDDFAYFVDASPKIADVKVGGVWRTMMFIGQGPGGTFYQAFDVSDVGQGVVPDSDSETAVVTAFNSATKIPFMWSFPQYSSFDHTIATTVNLFGDISLTASAVEKSVGQTWSAPAVGQIQDATGPYVVMAASGFLSTTQEAEPNRAAARAGTTLYLLDAGTGAVHDSYDVGDDVGKTNLKNALQADPTGMGPAGTSFVDQLYVGDTEGGLWRFDLSASGGTASLSIPIGIHDANQNNPHYGSLAAVNVGGPMQYMFISTGIDILPTSNKVENYKMLGISNDRSSSGAGTEEFSYAMARQAASNGYESATSAPAVAGDVVFFTTTTIFPTDPCRCEESALYALTYDGNTAYPAGTGGGSAPPAGSIEELTTWDGRATAPFVADQHLYFGVDGAMRVLGDAEDFNNGVTAQGVRITSWREIR